MKTSAKHLLLKQLILFTSLFVIAEIVLRLCGMRAGTLLNDFRPDTHPVYQARFLSDHAGINHILASNELLMAGSVINQQGFRGSFNYTPHAVDSVRKASGKEIVMIIGDSFVEGCCPDSVYHSFPDIIDRSDRYRVLNFGVAGTDPVQYELITRHYVPVLKPDHVVVAFYFGNDILQYNRTPSPGVPLFFPFKDNKWLFGVAPNDLSQKLNYNLKTADEAYTFYMNHYTLSGSNRNIIEKAIGYSVILSKIYLYIEYSIAKRRWQKKNAGMHIDENQINQISYNNLNNIRRVCDSAHIPLTIAGIPAPKECEEGAALKSKYKGIFRDIPWHVPSYLTHDDYDGMSEANHFNNQGHQKYAVFLKTILDHSHSTPKDPLADE